MTDKDKSRIKKMLCRMEGDPQQVDLYLQELREYADAEERVSWAWEVIKKVFEEDSIRAIENFGVKPPFAVQDGPEDEGDEDEEDSESKTDFDDEEGEEEDSEDSEDDEDEENTDDEEESDEESEDDDSEDEEEESDEEDEDEEESSDDDEEEEDSDEDDSDDDVEENEDEEEEEDDSTSEEEEGEEENENEEEEDASEDDEVEEVREKIVTIPKSEEKRLTTSVKKKEKPLKKAKSVAKPMQAEVKKESNEILADVVLPTAEKTDVIPMPTVEPVKVPETPLQGLQEAKIEKTAEGLTLRVSPEDAEKIHNGGVVYVLPADTGKEAELRVIQLRASTDENLDLARKMHEEIARSVAEERQIRDSMYELVVAYQELAKQLTENAQQAGEIRQKLVEGTVRAERFVNEDMSRMLQQRAQEATNDFYQESKDHFNDLFKAAVRKYKQFTEAVMDFQNKIADDSSRRIRTIETKVSMVEKVCYGTIVLLMINIVLSVIFKIFS